MTSLRQDKGAELSCQALILPGHSLGHLIVYNAWLLSQTEERKSVRYRGAETLVMVGAEHVGIGWPLMVLEVYLALMMHLRLG